jgi:magnesium transporter
MISVRRFNADGTVDTIDDPADISEVVGRDGHILWVDVSDPREEDLDCLQEEFSLHALAMEDVRKHGQRTKLEHYPSHAFIVAYTAALAEVDLFVGPDWVITVRERNPDGKQCPLGPLRERFDRVREEGTDVGMLLYSVLDVIVDGYFDKADEIDDRIEGLEDAVFSEAKQGESDIQAAIFQLRRELLLFRRAVAPMREVMSALLRHEVTWVEGAGLIHLQDVLDHVLRALDRIDVQRELMGNAVDAHLALISNRMNLVMKKMTSWGAILFASTLIAGIYGMNFVHMPELRWRYGYPMALGMMVTLTAFLWVWFRRRDWL